jgi:hypothetical protein
MKKLLIYKREILERTGYRKYPYKQIQQYIIIYNNKVVSNSFENDPFKKSLKVPFQVELDTRSSKVLEKYIANLGRKESEQWLRGVLKDILPTK